MSHWKRSYLDALEVPVWVPLNDSVAEKTQNNEPAQTIKSSVPKPNKPEPNEEAEDTSSGVKLRILHGELKAQYGFVIDANTDLKSALVTYQQLQFAWQAWLDEPLSAVLLQVITDQEQSASPATNDPQELVELNEFKGRLFDCGGLVPSQVGESHQKYISAPVFNFNQADKKAWWQLLQSLH